MPLAQTGFELLCGVPSEQARLQRYAGLMARFDNKNRTTWLISAMHERLRDASAKAASAASAGASSSSSTSNEQAVGYLAVGYAEGMEKLRQVLHSCDGIVPCSHDGDLHGLLGLLGHARLQLASTQLPADLPPSEGGAKVDPLPFTIDATVWKHAPPALISASRFREQKKRIRIVRRRQRWEQHAMKAAAAPTPPAASAAAASEQPAAGDPNKRPRREEAGNLAPGRDYSDDDDDSDNVEAYHNEGEEGEGDEGTRAAGAFKDFAMPAWNLNAAPAAAATVAKEAEGYKLFLAPKNVTGYKGVTPEQRGTTFQFKRIRDQAAEHIGMYSTVLEAAVGYAMHMAKMGIYPDETGLDPQVVKESGGYKLFLSRQNVTGYKGVTPNNDWRSFVVQIWDEKQKKKCTLARMLRRWRRRWDTRSSWPRRASIPMTRNRRRKRSPQSLRRGGWVQSTYHHGMLPLRHMMRLLRGSQGRL